MGDNQLENLVTNLIDIVGKTNSMMSQLAGDMQELKADMKVVKQDITDLKDKLDSMEGKTELLHKRLNRHTHQIADMEERLDLR